MESLYRYLTCPGPCGYLPDQTWRLEYDIVGEISPAEYLERLQQGWRRFGHSLFRPRCPACTACQSIRVEVERFRPDRSQRRLRKANEGTIRLEIGQPVVTRAKLALYDRFHAFQSDAKDWPRQQPKDAEGYAESFVQNPFPTQEWRYYLANRLVGVGYVDDLPGALSAIYFFYDPDERDRALGTWNVLSILERARALQIPHVYLGYYVADCRSMAYKGRFVPNQVLGADGMWRAFQD